MGAGGRGLPHPPPPHPGLPGALPRPAGATQQTEAQLPVLPEGPLVPSARCLHGALLVRQEPLQMCLLPPRRLKLSCLLLSGVRGAGSSSDEGWPQTLSLPPGTFSEVIQGTQEGTGGRGALVPLRGPPIQSEAGAPQGPPQTLSWSPLAQTRLTAAPPEACLPINVG